METEDGVLWRLSGYLVRGVATKWRHVPRSWHPSSCTLSSFGDWMCCILHCLSEVLHNGEVCKNIWEKTLKSDGYSTAIGSLFHANLLCSVEIGKKMKSEIMGYRPPSTHVLYAANMHVTDINFAHMIINFPSRDHQRDTEWGEKSDDWQRDTELVWQVLLVDCQNNFTCFYNGMCCATFVFAVMKC